MEQKFNSVSSDGTNDDGCTNVDVAVTVHHHSSNTYVGSSKQHWKKPAIKSSKVACLCCQSTDAILPLETLLYMGFGGWNVSKNGEMFFVERTDTEFEESKTLADIETMIGEDDESEYLAVFFSPLRGATYQRHSKNHWVLIEEDEGFA